MSEQNFQPSKNDRETGIQKLFQKAIKNKVIARLLGTSIAVIAGDAVLNAQGQAEKIINDDKRVDIIPDFQRQPSDFQYEANDADSNEHVGANADAPQSGAGTGPETGPVPRQEVVITGASVNLRADANTNSEIIGNVGRGTRFEFKGFQNGEMIGETAVWYQIEYQGQVGYVSAALARVDDVPADNSSTPVAEARPEAPDAPTDPEPTEPPTPSTVRLAGQEYQVVPTAQPDGQSSFVGLDGEPLTLSIDQSVQVNPAEFALDMMGVTIGQINIDLAEQGSGRIRKDPATGIVWYTEDGVAREARFVFVEAEGSESGYRWVTVEDDEGNQVVVWSQPPLEEEQGSGDVDTEVSNGLPESITYTDANGQTREIRVNQDSQITLNGQPVPLGVLDIQQFSSLIPAEVRQYVLDPYNGSNFMLVSVVYDHSFAAGESYRDSVVMFDGDSFHELTAQTDAYQAVAFEESQMISGLLRSADTHSTTGINIGSTTIRKGDQMILLLPINDRLGPRIIAGVAGTPPQGSNLPTVERYADDVIADLESDYPDIVTYDRLFVSGSENDQE